MLPNSRFSQEETGLSEWVKRMPAYPDVRSKPLPLLLTLKPISNCLQIPVTSNNKFELYGIVRLKFFLVHALNVLLEIKKLSVPMFTYTAPKGCRSFKSRWQNAVCAVN